MASFDKEVPRTPSVEGFSQNRKIDERLDILSARIEELTKLLNMKTERLGVKQRMIEERHEEMTQDFQKRLMAVLSRSVDMPRMELKIQELLEHQNQMVRNFENRLNHLKRVTENQELQLFKATAELDEARREIMKLKRG